MAIEGVEIAAAPAPRGFPLWRETLVAVLMAILVLVTGADMRHAWQSDPTLAHAPLVPVVTAFLLWRDRERLRHWTAAAPGGAVLLVLGALFYAAAYWADIEFVKPISLIGILFGLCWYFGGSASMRAAAGALGFLLFAVPWPTTLIARLQFPLQLTSSAYAAMFTGILGIPVQQDGVTLSVVPDPSRPPTYTILVAQQCSGLTSLIVLLAVGYLIACHTRVGWMKRLLLFGLTAPLALLANALRLTFVLAAGASHGAGVAQWVHDHEQPVLVLLCTLGLMAVRALMLQGTQASDGAASRGLRAHPHPSP